MSFHYEGTASLFGPRGKQRAVEVAAVPANTLGNNAVSSEGSMSFQLRVTTPETEHRRSLNERPTPSIDVAGFAVTLKDLASTQPTSADASTLKRPRMSLKELGIEMNNRRKATLKPKRGTASGFIDKDTSGTYDPSYRTPRKPLIRRQLNTNRERQPRDARARKPARGYAHMICFSFKGERGKAYLRSITPDSGPFPSYSSADEESNSDTDLDDAPLKKPIATAKRTRPRSKTGSIGKRLDGLTLDTLTVGHPQRRGCKSCFKLGNDECSLIEDGHEYPCTACDDADIDCELIVPPELKRVCEQCKRKRIHCSYKDDGGKGVSSCVACKSEGVSCCAAPLKESSYARRYDDDLATSHQPKKKSQNVAKNSVVADRVYVSCNQCRQGKVRCSLRRDQTGPCTKCRKKGEECRFVLRAAEPSIKSTPQVYGVEKGKEVSDPESDDGSSSEDFQAGLIYQGGYNRVGQTRQVLRKKKNSKTGQQGNCFPQRNGLRNQNEGGFLSAGPPRDSGKYIKIRTSFSHPIDFNYVPPPDGSESCSWCENVTFGLYGHGEAIVEVLPGSNGFGHEEIGDGKYMGFGQKGHPQTKMCEHCTTIRIAILKCQNHEMKRIRDIDPDIHDSEKWAASIAAFGRSDVANAQLIMNVKWCSVCTSAAKFECTTEEEHIPGMGEQAGCGLHLCETCSEILTKMAVDKDLREESQGREIFILDDVIREAQSGWGGYYDVGEKLLRADVSFLTSTGELFLRAQKAFGSADDIPITPRSHAGISAQLLGDRMRPSTKEQSREQKQQWQTTNLQKHDDSWLGEPLRKKVFRRSHTPSPLRSKPIKRERSSPVPKIRATPYYGDWMETRPVTTKKSWAQGSGTGERTYAYLNYNLSESSKVKRGKRTGRRNLDTGAGYNDGDDAADEYARMERGYY